METKLVAYYKANKQTFSIAEHIYVKPFISCLHGMYHSVVVTKNKATTIGQAGMENGWMDFKMM